MRSGGFITALFLSILLAWIFPAGPGHLPLEEISNIGIGLIFFFYGIKLSPSEFRSGFANYRVHLLIQMCTFVVFPLLTLMFIPLFEDGVRSELWLSLFFLSALPSTVSSSVVMVSMAKGNIPVAIFNASASGLLGIFLTPLLMSVFLTGSAQFEFSTVLTKLFLQVILPLTLGLLLHASLFPFVHRNSKKISFFDKSVIVLIAYISFCSAFDSKLFVRIPFEGLLLLCILIVLLFLAIYSISGYLGELLHLNRRDKISVRFCSSKKSLVHGSVMASIIFANSPGSAIFLLPVMLYHTFQLLIISHLAQRYSRHS